MRRVISLRSLADGLFLLRPVLLGPVWVIYAAGSLTGGSAPGWDLLFVSLLVAGVYVHNQLTDVAADRANKKLFLIGEGHVSRKAAWCIALALWGMALFWAATLGGGPHHERILLYLAALAVGLLYNASPFTWKAHPWLGFLANVLAHGPITFLAGYTAVAGYEHAAAHGVAVSAFAGAAILSVPYGLAVGAVYLTTTIVDKDGDRIVGKRTMAVRYGERPTAIMVGVLVLLTVVVADRLGDPWLATASAVTAPMALVMIFHPTMRAAQITVKVAVLALAAVVAIRWPWLLLLAALTFTASRLYYGWRFRVSYPAFKE